jgi:hypothetical protein
MSKTSELTEDFTPTPIFSRPPSPRKELMIDTKIKSRDIDRICLITDRKISDKQIEILHKYYSVYEITQDDVKKPINKLPRCDMYIFTLINNVMKPSDSWGQLYYAKSYRWLKLNNYTITYYRTMELIQDHSKLKYDYMIREWPNDGVVSKYDLAEQLMYNSIQYHIGGCGLCIACLCSRITCGDCMGAVLGLSFGV